MAAGKAIYNLTDHLCWYLNLIRSMKGFARDTNLIKATFMGVGVFLQLLLDVLVIITRSDFCDM